MDKNELLYTIQDTSHYVKSYYRLQEVPGTSDYEVTVNIPAAYVKDNYYRKNSETHINMNLRAFLF